MLFVYLIKLFKELFDSTSSIYDFKDKFMCIVCLSLIVISWMQGCFYDYF